MNTRHPSVSLAIPVYNEEAVVPELLRRTTAVLDTLPGGPHEIVFANDGGSDRTLELLEKAGSVPGEPRLDPPSANAVRGFNHVCFRVADLVASYARLIEHGAVPE